MTLRMNPLTTEFLCVPVDSKDPLTDYNVQIALVAPDARPTDADWKDAVWADDLPVRAKLLVGPEGGEYELALDQKYDVWIKILDNPEVPVRFSGRVWAMIEEG